MNNIKLLLLLWIISITLNIVGCSKPNTDIDNDIPVLTVTAANLKFESLPNIVYANGLIKPWQEAIISSEINGLNTTAVYVNVGDKVKKGQILAQLNVTQLNIEELSIAANLSDVKARLAKAKTEFNQASMLEKVGAISSQELLQYTTSLKIAQAQLKAEKAKLELQKLKITYTKIIAPDDGVISSSTAAVGNVVMYGNELFRLIRKNLLEWHAEVSTEQLSQIKPGQNVTIKTETGHNIEGRIRQIAPGLHTKSKNGLVFVDLKHNDGLKVEMSLSGQIYTGTFTGLMVPLKAIVSSDGFNYVYQLSETKHVNRVKVQLGTIYNDSVNISGPFNSKSKIVVSGAGLLNESDLVRVAKDQQ